MRYTLVMKKPTASEIERLEWVVNHAKQFGLDFGIVKEMTLVEFWETYYELLDL